MPIEILTPKAVAKASDRGLYADGGGLYLQVSKWGTKSWIFRYMRAEKSRDMGLGPLHTISLADARDLARTCRKLLLEGKDPIGARDARRAQDEAKTARFITFRDARKAYIAAHRASWKNAKHAEQWESTLATYADPFFGEKPVHIVDMALVLQVLEPIWNTKHETASRVRQRIEKILDWATTRKYRSGDNPARWKGNLESQLAKISKEERVEHQPALPYRQIGAFMADLRGKQTGHAARALELTILTWMRTDAVLGAKPDEFDVGTGVWTVPGARMKGKKRAPHKVPLCARAIEIVRAQLPLNEVHVFPGLKKDRPLSNAAMLAVVKRMHAGRLAAGEAGWTDVDGRMAVPHGFRSTAKDWAAEQTHFPNVVSEMALGHKISNAVEAAYRRGDLLEKRRLLMNAWANYCNAPITKGEVVTLRKAS